MMQHKTISYKGCDLFYKVIGEGKPVIFLHGFAEDGNVWQYQVDYLKDHYRLIIPDIPGSGKSTSAGWINNVDALADSIKAIADEEKIINCTIIGHSMGGYITLALVERYPQLLNGFGLFHSSAFADTDEKKQARLKSIEFIKTNGTYEFIKATTPGLFAPEFANGYPDKIPSLIESGKMFIEEVLIRYYEAMINRPDRTNILLNFTKPVLFIIGENDKAVPLEISLKQCYLPQLSYIYLLKNSAHMGMWEEKDKSNKILFDFLLAANR